MLKILLTLLNFLVSRLNAEADKRDKHAAGATDQINNLIKKRAAHKETSSKARSIASNISKLV